MASLCLTNVSLALPSMRFWKASNNRIKLLDDLNFSLRMGDRLGVVGLNGAGKTTLLRLLLGVYEPTDGAVNIQGSMSGLIDNGLGFEPLATGLENIFYRSLLLGKTRKEISSRVQNIIEFSELENDIHKPIKYYSTGMGMRLNFAIATEWRTDILVLDEVVGAGDRRFIEKAEKRINDNIASAKITVVASHNRAILEKYCNIGLHLNAGNQMEFGDLSSVLNNYYNQPA